MKKILILISIMFMFAGNAYAEGRTGVQFSSGGNIGILHYGENFAWAAGGSVGFIDGDEEVGDMEWDTSSLEFSIFARKNFKIMDKTYLGLGVNSAWGFDDVVIDGFATDVDTWSIAPYFILDYHLSNNFILNAGVDIVRFKEADFEVNSVKIAESDSVQYLSPFFNITFLF